jgi:hypothetical protein
MTYGVYAKGLAYQDGYPHQWKRMVTDHPEILEGSSNTYQNWEVTDPERWIPHGHVVIRVDSRGAGWSPGLMDCNSPREINDLYQCIEWAGTRPWSNGKLGLLGISYYASNQWRVAGLHPPHLAAIIPWEGQNDRYRDSGYHGGILSEFQKVWARHQVASARRRLAPRALGRSPEGHGAAAHLRQLGRPGHPPARQLQRLRGSVVQAEVAGGPRRLALVAVLVGLRSRSAEALLRSLSEGRRQRLGADVAGNTQRPPPRRAVRPALRAGVAAGPHAVDEALPRPGRHAAEPDPGGGAGEDRIRGDGRRAHVLDDGGDGDRDHGPDGGQAVRRMFMGSTDPNTPIANGWLRASHRRLDPARTLPYRPYHPHDRVQPLTPGDVYECDVEIVTSCIVVPAGWTLALSVRGKDYEYEGELSEFAKTFHYGTRGTGGMTHADPDDRPPAIFDTRVTLYSGGDRQSWLLLPIIPATSA